MQSIKPHIIKYGGIWYTIVDNKIAYPSSTLKGAMIDAKDAISIKPRETGVAIH